MSAIAIGSKAPDFEIDTDGGAPFRLSANKGSAVVLYFYGTDDTETCTNENVEFSRLADEFSAANTKLVGISEDSVASHARFRAKYDLKPILGADPDHKAIAAFDLWQPKKTFGREYLGLVRTTILVGPDGKIANIWTVKRVKGHADEVLEAARALNAKA
ncbi:Thiol peroxidase, Bcp-type [Devosia sp. DBB001]|jgi:peroxiredoxin Q/BCP|nr:redoxin domain-containing protein [Devosia sp. D6-9]CDP51071.1 Thiol peroxidase, Bcp-type [Devosia sp. DBB001]